MHTDYPALIAAADVYPVASISPLEPAPKLSQRLGQQVWLKREDLQPVRSFKLRGAYNMVSQLSPEQRERGVICASAGNHAQGLALAAQKLGIRAVIVMPQTTPAIKVDAVRALGGEVVLHADTFDEANAHAQALAAEQGLSYVPPYDHPLVIAGQGTVGKEILEQLPSPPNVIFVPVGGGGLIAGIAAWVKYAAPDTRIVAVEPDDAACLDVALRAGERVPLSHVGLFADGVAVRIIGEHPFELAQLHVDAVVTCSVDEICAAVRDIFEDNRSVLEPAGALAVAGMKRWAELYPEEAEGQSWVCINSGANVNFDRLRHIAERAELGEHREALLAVTLPEKPGSFMRFCEILGRRAVTEFNYRFADAAEAHVFVGLKLSLGRAEREAMMAEIAEAGMAVTDLSGDEMAKVHIRYMVGGRAGAANEHLFRFEFPERPGALRDFLERIAGRWNISLFHYRNHGAAFGRVLCGMQVPPEEIADCRSTLDGLGYEYSEETDNPAYRLFLA
ncbi:MAG: threonine ammonia-lyase, biosynthetic [Oceanococcaceae bacterium]